MKNIKSQFIRQYVRASKSPWDDCSTILLLADVVNEQAMELNFNNYIYLHRDSVGKILGISISNSMLELDDTTIAWWKGRKQSEFRIMGRGNNLNENSIKSSMMFFGLICKSNNNNISIRN